MSKQNPRQVRIIGGNWRGHKIPVVDIDGLRPTPDRIRETLFNWLALDCPGASVLDCFAGTGVLGFEALSRGAKRVILVEQNKLAGSRLQQELTAFNCDQIALVSGDVLKLIPDMIDSFDLVFVDPPYAMPCLRHQVLESLLSCQRLNQGARIYVEWPATELFELPVTEFTWLKQKKAGQVNYGIAEWRSSR
jgi:16S rRNA (guanine966-N2)-methyltransferase